MIESQDIHESKVNKPTDESLDDTDDEKLRQSTLQSPIE